MCGGGRLGGRVGRLIGKYSRGAIRVFAVFEANQIGNSCQGGEERQRESRSMEKVRGQKAEHVCVCVCVLPDCDCHVPQTH